MNSQKNHSLITDLIGCAMRAYRKSPLHSERAGKIFAKLLSYFIHFRKNKQVIKNINGINYELDLDEVIDSSLFFSSTFEKPEEEIINSLLKPGMNVIDVGANIGYYTFRMASIVQPKGKVYAFEPTQWAYKKLIRNASLNPLIQNVKLIKIGLADMDLPKQKMSFQSSYRIDGKQTKVLEEIQLEKLDSFVKRERINRIDLIKIDVDGFEGKVISGSMELLKKFKPFILFEINPNRMNEIGDNYVEMINQLLIIGYKFEDNQAKKIKDLIKYIQHRKKDVSLMILAKQNIE